MKHSREVQIVAEHLEKAGMTCTEAVRVAVIAAMKQIRQEKHDERVAQKQKSQQGRYPR